MQIAAKVLSALALWVITLSAQSAPTESVTIGAYINGIRSIDLKAGSAEIDLYLWLRSSSKRNLLDSIEIMNGNGSEKTAVVHKATRGENYQSARLQLSAYQIFNLKKFPLDNQVLRIVIEDFEADISSLQFIADSENTKVSKSIVLPGWKIGDAHIKVEPFSYETNYGDTSLGESNSVFSRAVIEIPIEREGIGYFFNRPLKNPANSMQMV